MFAERFKKCMEILQASPGEMADRLGCGRSYISKLRGGARVPGKDGEAIRRISDGILRCAEEKNRKAALLAAMGEKAVPDREVTVDRLSAWLCEGEKDKAGASEPDARVFGQRLNIVMELTGLSNSRLGKLLNVDPSYVSRFRNGQRSLRSNPTAMRETARSLLDRVLEQHVETRLSELSDIPLRCFDDGDTAFSEFYSWLYDVGNEKAGAFDIPIEKIEAIKVEITPPGESFESVCEASCAEEAVFGNEGLRLASLRLLSDIVRRKARAVYLYSEESMGWMTEDPAFTGRWSALMYYCLKNGTEFYVIHNLDRRYGEILSAVGMWAKLYLSGRIHSYYCRSHKSERLVSTLFLCPGVGSISGCNAIGMKDAQRVYRSQTDEAVLRAQKASFDALFESSEQLTHIYYLEEIRNRDFRTRGGFSSIGSMLSHATMPDDVLETLLQRSGVSDEKRRQVRELCLRRGALFRNRVRNGHAEEFIRMPKKEELRAGNVRADIPGVRVCYDEETYARHIEHILALRKEYPSYRFYPLMNAPAFDFKLLYTDKSVFVFRSVDPEISIHVEHPELFRVFRTYLDNLKRSFEQQGCDPETLPGYYRSGD